MTYPYMRTYDEAHLYMRLRACVCGEPEFDKMSTHLREDGKSVVRYEGVCVNCGRTRRFTFQMPEAPAQISFDTRYGVGNEPSQVIDPGEWLGVADIYESNARAELEGGDLTEENQLTAVYYLLSAARSATEEAAKFIPAGQERVPESAFRSQAGRMLFELVPDRFTRAALIGELAERQKALDDFDERFGTDEGTEAGSAEPEQAEPGA